MKMTDALVDILQLAKTVESTIQTETLSKQLLQNVGKLGNTTTEVHSVTKCSQSVTMGVPKVMTRIGKDAVIVAVHTLLNNAKHMGRNVSNVRKRIISPCFAEEVVVYKN